MSDESKNNANDTSGIAIDKVPEPTKTPITVPRPTKPEKYDYDNEIQESMVEITKSFNKQLNDEKEERKNLILYLKVILPIFSFLPLLVIFYMIKTQLIVGSIEILVSLLTAVAAVPIEIVGVLSVVSEKLFADTFRTSLPELLGKYKEFTGPKSI